MDRMFVAYVVWLSLTQTYLWCKFDCSVFLFLYIIQGYIVEAKRVCWLVFCLMYVRWMLFVLLYAWSRAICYEYDHYLLMEMTRNNYPVCAHCWKFMLSEIYGVFIAPEFTPVIGDIVLKIII